MSRPMVIIVGPVGALLLVLIGRRLLAMSNTQVHRVNQKNNHHKAMKHNTQ
jgi:glucose uptake protein GlcU